MVESSYRKIFVLLALLLVSSMVYATIDVNVSRIDTNPDASVFPTFSYYSDGNLTIDFNIQSTDNNTFLIDLNYSTSNLEGTGTVILNDYNSGTTICSDGELSDQTTCSWDWNISSSLVSDGNYYILINVDNETATDFNASDNIFMIDNTAPSTTWDGNTSWQATDANVQFTCSDGTGSGCATTGIRIDSDGSDTISWGSWITSASAVDLNAYFTSDGNYAIDFNSTDSAGNIESTNRYYVLIDSTAPVISNGLPTGTATTQPVTISVTTNELASCKYSLTDQAYSAMTGTPTSSSTSHSWDFFWGYNDNGGKTYYVRCADTNVGNVNSSSTTITFTLNMISGDDGSISSDTGEESEWTNNIAAGSSQIITYTNKNLVDSVKLFAENRLYRAELIYNNEVDSIEGVSKPNKLYKYFEITFKGDNEDLAKAEISFKVSKTWAKENNFQKKSFALYRLIEGKWVKLETTYVEEDSDYYYYTAITPGFSYFAIIGGEEIPVSDNDDVVDDTPDVTPPVDDTPDTVDDAPDVTPPVDDQDKANGIDAGETDDSSGLVEEPPAQDLTGTIILGIIIALIAVGGYYYINTKDKKKLGL